MALHFRYPLYDVENMLQRFPFRTFTMLLVLLIIVSVSYIARWLFTTDRLPKHWDIWECVVNLPLPSQPGTEADRQAAKQPHRKSGKYMHELLDMDKSGYKVQKW